MLKIGKIIFYASIIFLFIFNVRAEEIKKVAQTSMKWLSIPVGARAMAMGNAYYCYSGNVDDVFWNPAGIGSIESAQFYFSQLAWIADIKQSAVVFGLPISNLGVFTVSVRYIDFGTLQGTRLASNAEGWEHTGDFSPSSYQIGVGYSKRLSESFSYGLQISYATENLGTVEYAPVIGGSVDNPIDQSTSLELFNLDFGVLYYTGFHDLRLAMTLNNFSGEKGYGNVGNPIPMDLRIGMAMDILVPFFDENIVHSLTFAFDISHPRDYSERLHFGLEYTFQDLVALRAGYKSNYDEEGASFGAGILPNYTIGWMKIGLDYAFVPFGVFGSVQTFSLSLHF